MSNETVKIGIVTSAHGVAGEINVKALTDFPQRFKKTVTVLIEGTRYKLTKVVLNDAKIILRLEGIDDRTVAEKLRGKYLEVPANETVRLPEGSYYVWQIIGCGVFEDGMRLGEITDVLSTGSNDVYVIDTGSGQLLLPALKKVVLKIDAASKRVEVKRLPELI